MELLRINLQKKLYSGSTLTEMERNRFEKSIRGLRIYVTHRGKMKKRFHIHSLTKKNAKTTKFAPKPGDPLISIEEYFVNTYQMVLKFPYLPLIKIAREGKPVYFPIEVCNVDEGSRSFK